MKYDLLQEAVFAGLPLPDCPIVDVHAHFGPATPFPLYDASEEGLQASMDRMGVAALYGSPFQVLCQQYAAAANDYTLELVRRYPGRIFGYLMLNPAEPAAILPELQRCHAAGLRAIKIHTYDSLPYSHPNYEQVFAFAAEYGLPILAHTAGEELRQLESALLRFPQVCFILAHAGCLERAAYAECAQHFPNVCLETCVSQCPRGLIEFFVHRGLSDRMLWGTDMPLICAGHQLGRVVFADISLEDKYRILYRNAHRILPFPLPAGR